MGCEETEKVEKQQNFKCQQLEASLRPSQEMLKDFCLLHFPAAKQKILRLSVP